MILGYLAYAIVFTFGVMVGAALAAGKIEDLQRQLRAQWQQQVDHCSECNGPCTMPSPEF